MLMAAARLDLPSVFVYNGSILPGQHNGVALDITSVFEAVGACALGTITEEELGEIERKACPGEGACGGMFTANTMSSIAEAIGMSLPGTASPPAVDRRREDDARRAGEAVVRHARARHHAPHDHDEAGVRERDRRHVARSAGRPTPCCTCWPSPTRPASRSSSTTSTASPPSAAHRRHEAGRQVPHERPRPRRRRAGRDEAPARCRPAARRRADRDRQDDGREPRRDRSAAARRRRRPPARRADPHRGRRSSCSRGRWRRRARWSRSPG